MSEIQRNFLIVDQTSRGGRWAKSRKKWLEIKATDLADERLHRVLKKSAMKDLQGTVYAFPLHI